MVGNMRYHIFFTSVSSLIWAGSVKSLVQSSPSIEAEWSVWIDNSHPSSVLSDDEGENLNQVELGRLCPYGVITETECVPVEGVDGLYKGLVQNITCDVQNGLKCLAKYNRPHGCLDYKIRYRCSPYPVRKVRKRQASMPLTNCNSWHPWINENHPNSTNKNDHENLTMSELLSFCPINNGAEITKIECKDDRDEAFSGPFNNTANKYAGNCTNYQEGLSCEMIDTNGADKCPDFSFRFYCNCSVSGGLSTLTVNSGRTPVTHRPSHLSKSTTSSVRTKTSAVMSTSRSGVTSTVRSSVFYMSVRTSPTTSNLFSKLHLKPTRGTGMSMSSVGSPVSSMNRLTTKRSSVNTSPVLIPNHKPVSTNTSISATTMPSVSPSDSNRTGLTTMNSGMNATTTGTRSNSEQQSDGFTIGSQFLWLILFIVCFVLCVFNFILMLFLHRRAMKHVKGKLLTKVRPLNY